MMRRIRHYHISPAQQLRSVAGRYWIGEPGSFASRVRPIGQQLLWGPPHQESWGVQGRATRHGQDRGVRDDRMARMEAVLFLAKEPLHPRRLARFAHLADGTEARTLVDRLNALYRAERRAFSVVEVGGGFQLRTQPEFARWLRRVQYLPVEARLSQPAMETLAVIAYRQPVLRAEIDAIRGVQCAEVIRQLLERDLVKVTGRSDELGRPYYYGTTKKFLQVFGLRDLSDLPRDDLLRLPGEAFPESETGRVRKTDEGEKTVKSTTGAVTIQPWEEEEHEHDPILDESAVAQKTSLRAAEEDEDWEEDEDEDDWEDDDEDDDDWEDEDEEFEEDGLEDEDWEDEDEEWEEVEDSDEEEEDWEDDEDEDWEEEEEAEDEP